MSKYHPLRDYLRNQNLRDSKLSFLKIQNILGFVLPKSAERPQWWANTADATSRVQREAWKGAGFDTFLVATSWQVRFVSTIKPRAEQTMNGVERLRYFEVRDYVTPAFEWAA